MDIYILIQYHSGFTYIQVSLKKVSTHWRNRCIVRHNVLTSQLQLRARLPPGFAFANSVDNG